MSGATCLLGIEIMCLSGATCLPGIEIMCEWSNMSTRNRDNV